MSKHYVILASLCASLGGIPGIAAVSVGAAVANSEQTASILTTAPCPSLVGHWSVSESVTVTQTVNGQSQSDTQNGVGSVDITQTGCSFSFYSEGTNPLDGSPIQMLRTGTISCGTVAYSGVATVPVPGVTCSPNVLNGTGRIVGNQIIATTSATMICRAGGQTATVVIQGQETFTADHIILSPPVILTQPQDLTVLLGADAVFSVSAAGTGALTYQWQKDGANLPGATASSLKLAKVTAAQAGNYRVSVTSCGGSLLSSVARLTISGPSLEGYVLEDSLTGPPLADVTVSLLGSGQTRQAVTDQRGWYFFADLTAGATYKVTPSKLNYSFVPLEQSSTPAGKSVLPAFIGKSTCSSWKQPGVNGRFVDGTQWIPGRAPAEKDEVCLTGGQSPTRIEFEGPDAIPSLISSLSINSGTWELALNQERDINIQTVGLRLAETGHGLKVKAGSTLKVNGGAIEVPTLQIEPGGIIDGTQLGTINITGNWLLDATSRIQFVLGQRHGSDEMDTPLIRLERFSAAVGPRFHAQGALRLTPAPGYRPVPGDRFRLIEFPTDVKDVSQVFQNFVFPDFDPDIVTDQGVDRDYFWGLVFREAWWSWENPLTGNRTTFLEAVVLRKPRIVLAEGVTRPLADGDGGHGLVFITHGTASDIQATMDLGLGEMALAITAFVKDHQLESRWKVAFLDWHEYATKMDLLMPFRAVLPFDNEISWNPATSAQFGLGIAESLVRWMQWHKVSFDQVHVMSHSSGSWLANRFLSFDVAKAWHVTLFDAFTPPGYPCPAETVFWCGRFEGVLGLPKRSEDFVEQYVDRSPWNSPLGTNTRLPAAVNFDVTDADEPSFPWFLRTKSFAFVEVLAAHSWPYVWYLQTVYETLHGSPANGQCGGFVLSPVYLDALGDRGSAITTIKANFVYGTEKKVTPEGCHPPAPTAIKLVNGLLTAAQTAGGGAIQVLNGETLRLTTTVPSAIPNIGLESAGQTQFGRVNLPVDVTQPVSSLRFDLMFQSPVMAHLTAWWDNAAVQEIDQADIGTNQTVHFEVPVLVNPTGNDHVLAFEVRALGSEPATAVLSKIAFIYDLSPIVARVQSEGDTLHFTVRGSPVAADHVLEFSTNVVNWSELRRLGPVPIEIPISDLMTAAVPQKYFRIRAEGLTEEPVFIEEPVSSDVQEGQPVLLAATVAGNPPLSFQWQHNGTNLPGAVDSTLVLPAVDLADAGDYFLVAENRQGTTTNRSGAKVVVHAIIRLPSISVQPLSQSADIGETVSFSVQANGTEPLFYQWRAGEADLPGATNSVLHLTNVRTNDTASYRVVVSNAAGSITSQAATLVVRQTRSLVSRYTFDINAADSKGGRNASFLGHASVDTADRVQGTGSLLLKSNGDCAFLPGGFTPLQNLTNGFTITLWMKASASPANQQGGFADLFATDGFDREGTDFVWHYAAPRSLAASNHGFLAALSSAKAFTIGSAASLNPPQSAWHHAAAVYDKTVLSVYADGVALASLAQPGNPNLGQTAHIGAWDDGGAYGLGLVRFFQGRIDDVQIYATALTASEIQWLAQHPGEVATVP